MNKINLISPSLNRKAGALLALALFAGACSRAPEDEGGQGVDTVNSLPVVDSINGQEGDVVLSTNHIPEGDNKYYTDARVAAAPAVQAKENGLGNPPVDGMLLSSASDGTRSWIHASQAFNWTREIMLFEEWMSSGSAGALGWTAANGGTGASSSATSTAQNGARPGLIALSSGSTASGRATLHLGSLPLVFGGGEVLVEFAVYIPTLSNGADAYVFRGGTGDDTGAGDHVDGAYFEYDAGVSANWRLKTANNSVRSVLDSGVPVTAGSWTRLRLLVAADASSVEYSINGSSVGSINSNIPSSAGRFSGPNLKIVKSLGTTSRSVLLDYFAFRQLLSSAR